MLSAALQATTLDVSGEELLDHVLACRVRMLRTGTASGASAYEALAAELAYDRALMHLCAEVGIVADPKAFDQPQAERARLEECLATQFELDLVDRSRSGIDEWDRPSAEEEACWQV